MAALFFFTIVRTVSILYDFPVSKTERELKYMRVLMEERNELIRQVALEKYENHN